MTGYSPSIPHYVKRQPQKLKRANRRYLLVRDENASTISIIDTTTKRGCQDFDHLFLDLGWELVGSVESKLTISELMKCLKGGDNE